MKRLTLIFKPLSSSIATAALKDELVEELLRIHPRLTFKIGQVIADRDGGMFAQIAIEGKRAILDTALMRKNWKLPVKLESIGWGWLTMDEGENSPEPAISAFDVDPLATVKPAEGQEEFRLNKKRTWLRYVSLIGFTIVMILLLIANGIHNDSPLLQWIYIVVFTVWLFSLNDTPFDFRVYTEKVSCSRESLEIKYWFKRLSFQFQWEDVWEMDYTEPVCEIFVDGRKSCFLMSERYGCKEQKVVLRTIVDRAALNYVEGTIRTMLYRRYEAPVGGRKHFGK